MGRFLRATMLRQSNHLELHAEVKKHGSKGSAALIRATFEVAVRRYFPRDVDLRIISAFVQEMRKAFGPAVPVLETEAMIRAALGEDLPTDDIGLQPEIEAKTLTLAGLADRWDRDESVVNSVLVEAEKLVRQRGVEPTLAT